MLRRFNCWKRVISSIGKSEHQSFSFRNPACYSSVSKRMASSQTFKFAAVQMLCTEDKQRNIQHAVELVKKAAAQGAKVVSLPEIWNSPYATSSFPIYAEVLNEKESECFRAMSAVAKEANVFLVGGSIPEREGDKLYNTCLVFDDQGNNIGKYRKVHLFDIDIPGKMTFKESETLSPGRSLCVLQLPMVKIGIAICYDMRFPELFRTYGNQGVQMMIIPGAFNMTTGPKHWELLQRSRAVDYQIWVATVSPARNPEASYKAYGHSSVISPWGQVVAQCKEGEGGDEAVLVVDINLDDVTEVRTMIPVLKQRVDGVY